MFRKYSEWWELTTEENIYRMIARDAQKKSGLVWLPQSKLPDEPQPTLPAENKEEEKGPARVGSVPSKINHSYLIPLTGTLRKSAPGAFT